jgi:hypothetical protein
LICECLLQRRWRIPLTFMVFDVLRVGGQDVTARPYRERRRILEDMRLDAPHWKTPAAFDDGAALWEAVCEHELEGRRRQATLEPLPPRRSRLDQDQEPRVLALEAGAGERVEDSARAAVRLASPPRAESGAQARR